MNTSMAVFIKTAEEALDHWITFACYKNLPEVAESDEDDNKAFRSAMDMLDQIAAFKRDNPGCKFELSIN